MSDIDKTRKLHRILDRLLDRNVLDSSDIAQLRAALPELPIQKTLEEIAWDIDFARAETFCNDWKEELFGDLEAWLTEQHTQLRAHLEGVKGEAVPRLPEGIRLADHEQFGRVITSPKPNRNGVYDLLVPRPNVETGADWDYAHECELTFIDAEPAHPEFLGTEADYENAPDGTIVAWDGSLPWHKFNSLWVSTPVPGGEDDKGMAKTYRRVLRWGDGE